MSTPIAGQMRNLYFNSTKKGTTNGSVRPFLLIGTEGEYIDEDE